MNIIKQIEQWQKDRGLDKEKYELLNEATNIVEELLEANGFKISKDKRNILRKKYDDFTDKLIEEMNLKFKQPTDEDRIDALFDVCVFAIGGMLKLGYKPECVFIEGIKHISSRTGSIVNGKFHKDTNVKTYEPQYNKCKR